MTHKGRMKLRSDPSRVELIGKLEEKARDDETSLWRAVARELSRSRKDRREVNIHRINKYSTEGETVVVPGKVLGDGRLDHKINVAAYRFTDSAVEKINAVGGKTMTLDELMKENPGGSGIKLIG